MEKRVPFAVSEFREDRTLDNSVRQATNDDPWGKEKPRGAEGMDLLSLIPLVAIVALVTLVGLLVWLVQNREAEQARTKLATDALWVEQTLRFQLSVDEDMLVRLGLDAANEVEAETLETRARLHMAANPEVLSIVWHDVSGGPVLVVPGVTAPDDPELVARLVQGGSATSRPVFGAVRGTQVTFGVKARDDAGVMTATVSLPIMLERHIPWWIAEQYGVRIAGIDGKVLAKRGDSETGTSSGHSISFDPPLRGTVLQIMPHASGKTSTNVLLTAAIAGLSAFAILALVALYRNGLRRRRAEQRLRGEMAFRRSMEDSLTVGLRAKDHDGRVLYVNAAFCRLVGFPAEELIGRRPPMPYWSPNQLTETLHRQTALASGGALPQSFETKFVRKDGTEIDVQVYEAPLIDARGAHRGWMGSVIDISESKRAARLARSQDENLARTGRLVTMGEMASTLAHELNQPLSAVASYAAGIRNLIDNGNFNPELVKAAIEKLSLQTSRAGQIIRRIQDFVKKREPRLVKLSLFDVVRDTAGFLAADARENRVKITTNIGLAPDVIADRILIEQVLINLMRNGMEAMAEGKRSGDELSISLARNVAGQAVIEVADRGAGIADETAAHLFDAFTSTKAQGMGMGLNICRSIVELHRGQLTHEPRAGGGTIFRVTLPAAQIEQGVAAE